MHAFFANVVDINMNINNTMISLVFVQQNLEHLISNNDCTPVIHLELRKQKMYKV